MSLLLIALPPGMPGTYEFATSRDGQDVGTHGSAAAALLPAAGRSDEVVAVVPASLLSWQRVQLPKGIGPGSPRLRAILSSLLEEQLLDEAEQLHFALEPSVRSGDPAWVAVCDRGWISAHLQALEAAGRTVNRIVPELSPSEGALQVYLTGVPERAQLLWSGDAVAGGVRAMPFSAGAISLLPPPAAGAQPEGQAPADFAPQLFAEPAVAALAEESLGLQPVLQQASERWLLASRSGWDLAQFDFSRGSRARLAKRAGSFWRDLVHAPAWRPARWGIVFLLLAQLVGLNWWAWETRTDLAARRARIHTALTQTFPQVQVVVNAPVQMSREVALLRQATGAASARDLEPLLTALASGVPEAGSANRLEYSAGELRLHGVSMAASDLTQANERLRPLGYQLQTEADAIVMRPGGTP